MIRNLKKERAVCRGRDEQGGGKAVGVQFFLQIRRTVGFAIWCRDVGGCPPHGTVTGGVPGPGGADTDRAVHVAEGRK